MAAALVCAVPALVCSCGPEKYGPYPSAHQGGSGENGGGSGENGENGGSGQGENPGGDGENPGGNGGQDPAGFSLTDFAELNAVAEAGSGSEAGVGAATEGDHASAAARSSLVLDFRSKTNVTPNSGTQVTESGPVYPRFARMGNGKWILTYHNRTNNACGYDCRYMLSDDLIHWRYGNYMFQRYSISDPAIAGNKRTFSNCIPYTLKDGSTMAVASYRSNLQYVAHRYANGIVMRRTTDGVNWSQTPTTAQEILSGQTNWEPWIHQRPSGRIEVYFTDAYPEIGEHNSGTALIYSDDNGATWSGKKRVIRHEFDHTNHLYTDQMISVARIPGSEQLFFASEIWNGSAYRISYGKSNADGTWTELADNEEGPSDYRWAQIKGAAPTVLIFPSGEMVLSYNRSSTFYGRFAVPDYDAILAAPERKLLEASGFWGTVHEAGTHKMVTAVHSGADIVIAQYCLNHDIKATARTSAADGDNKEWLRTDEALFLGANGQAQATLRCSQDAQNLYFLIEVKDNDLKSDDYVKVFLAPYGTTAPDDKCRSFVSKLNTDAAQAYKGTLDSASDTDTGWYAEIQVPRSDLVITDGKLLLNFLLHDSGSDDELLAAETDFSKWVEVSGL